MELGEREEGITDIKQAAKLAQQQGNINLYQQIQEIIKNIALSN